MKSLVESLFDSNNITKDITFGDVYSIVKDNENWKTWPLDKMFSVQRVKNKSGIKRSDKNETVHDGILQLILNIKLEKSPDDPNFIRYIEDRITKETFDLFLSSFPSQYRYPRANSITGNDKLHVYFRGGLDYKFERK